MARGLGSLATLLGLFIVLMSGSAFAQKLEVSAFDLPELITPAKTGYYDQLLNQIFALTDSEIHFVSGPINRVRLQFLSKKSECLLPVDDLAVGVYELSEDAVVKSAPFNHSRLHVFSRKDQPRLSSLAEMKAHYIVFRLGYDIPEEIEAAQIPITTVSTAQNGINMLKIGRAHGFLEYVPDFFLVAKREKFEEWHYDPALHFYDAAEKILCHKSERTQRFIEQFDHILALIRADGTCAKLLGPSMVQPIKPSVPAKY